MSRSPSSLRTLSFARITTRLAFLLPFAMLAGACGDDTTLDLSGDAGKGNEGGKVNEGGPGTDGGSGNDGATGNDSGDGAVTPDTTAPTVLSTDPAPSATGASISNVISATFSEAMTGSTITTGSTFTVKRGAATVNGAVSYVDNTATFAPNAPLSLDTTYTATITTAAKDVAGNALAADYTWTFKTDATLPIGPAPVLLGAAGNYVVLAQSEITNVPTSKITGNVGISPAAASYITGFSMTKAGTYWTATQVVGKIFAADNDVPTPNNLTIAIANMQTAYTDAAGRPTPDFLDMNGGDIGGATLAPGLYKWGTSVTVPGNVILQGAANDVWIFQISGDLMVSANKSMTLMNGARAKNVYWQVAGLVDMGVSAHAEGIILSKTAIKLGSGASINGRLLAQTAVNLSANAITAPAP